MANNDFDTDEWVRVTLSNKDLKAMKKGVAVSDSVNQMVNFDKHLKAFEAGLKSAVNGFEYFNNALKLITGGAGSQSFFLRKSSLATAIPAIEKVQGRLDLGAYKDATGVKHDNKYTVDLQDVIPLTFTRKRAGTLSQSLAKEAMDKIGGRAYFANAGDKAKDIMTFSLFADKATYEGLGSEREAKKYFGSYLNDVLKSSGSTRSSLQVTRARNQKEAERKAKEEEAQKKKEENEAKASHRSAMRAWTAILTTLTLIANITRRILTAVLDRGSELKKQAVTATELQMPAKTVREAEFVERSAGVSKGAYTGGVQDIQSAFGDITAIDEGKLKILAPFMGGAVEDLVRSGMGGKDSEKLMKMIIDSAFKTAMSGKNSLGQDVGVADAVRNFTTVLNKISPHVAEMFGAMAYDNMYGLNRGAVGNFDDWWNLNNKRHSWEWNVLDTERLRILGQLTDQLAGSFSKLSKYLEEEMLGGLANFLAWLNSFDTGKSPAEKLKDRGEAREQITEALGRVQATKEVARNRVASIASSLGISPDEIKYIIKGENIPVDTDDYPERFKELRQKLMHSKEGLEFYEALNYLDKVSGVEGVLTSYKNELNKGNMPAINPLFLLPSAVADFESINPVKDFAGENVFGYLNAEGEVVLGASQGFALFIQGNKGILNAKENFIRNNTSSNYLEDALKIIADYDENVKGDWSFEALLQDPVGSRDGLSYTSKGKDYTGGISEWSYTRFLSMALTKMKDDILPRSKNGETINSAWSVLARAYNEKNGTLTREALEALYYAGEFTETDLVQFKLRAIPDKWVNMSSDKQYTELLENIKFKDYATTLLLHNSEVAKKLYPEWENKYADVRFNATMNKDSRTLTIKVQGYNAKGEKVAEQTVFSNESVDYGENRESDLGNIFN